MGLKNNLQIGQCLDVANSNLVTRIVNSEDFYIKGNTCIL